YGWSEIQNSALMHENSLGDISVNIDGHVDGMEVSQYSLNSARNEVQNRLFNRILLLNRDRLQGFDFQRWSNLLQNATNGFVLNRLGERVAFAGFARANGLVMPKARLAEIINVQTNGATLREVERSLARNGITL